VDWLSGDRIAARHGVSRWSIYRHAHACGLDVKRSANVRKALEFMIERAGEVEVNAAVIVSAIQAYAKINSSGRWIERRESVNLTFERMTQEELELYASTGQLPDWTGNQIDTPARLPDSAQTAPQRLITHGEDAEESE
jgi:hypothetical protein